MANTHSSIATDSEAGLRDVIGHDSTATFEDDPKFIDSDATSTASSENIPVQRDTDDLEDSDEEETEGAEDEDDEDDELDDEEEDDDDEEEEESEEDEDDDDGDEEEHGDEEKVVPLHAKTFEDRGEIDEHTDNDETGAEIDEDGDDLDTDRVGDAALGLSSWPIAAATSACVSISI